MTDEQVNCITEIQENRINISRVNEAKKNKN